MTIGPGRRMAAFFMERDDYDGDTTEDGWMAGWEGKSVGRDIVEEMEDEEAERIVKMLRSTKGRKLPHRPITRRG